MTEKEDWIRLLVKYKGKCAQCGKEIPQGEYAMWSRSSKAIKHVKCESDKSPKGNEDPAMPELECFICGKTAGCAECGFEADCNRTLVSQACICALCLSEKQAYKNYQDAFLVKMRKAAKIKT